MTKRWLVGLVIVALLGSAWALSALLRRGPTSAVAPASAEDARDAQPDRSASNADQELDSGRAQAYELSFRQELAAGGSVPTVVRVNAVLAVAPRDSTGRDRVKLGPVSVEGNGAPAASELAIVFARVRDSSGHLEAIEVPHGTPTEARSYLRAIAGALEYTLEPGASWQATELDVGGSFTTSYRRLDSGQIERYRRQFVANSAHPGLAVSMRLEGRTLLSFGASEVLETLETDERAELSAGDSWRMRARLVVSLKRKGDISARWAGGAAALERESIDARSSANGKVGDDDRARLHGRSLADLRAELESVDELPESMERTRERARLVQDHAALARTSADAMRAMTERLMQPTTPASERSLLAGSLAGAGTPEASHALGGVLRHAPLADARLHAAVALNVSPAHDAETLGVLQAGAKDADPDVASAARLALGNALRTVHGAGASSPSSADALAEAYASATSIEERTDALSAIGNSGDASLLPLVEHALADPNPQIRETATFALRFMSAAADPLLGDQLLSPFPEVRTAAVRALELRSIGAVRPSIERALAVEPIADLKRALERLLARSA